LAVEEAEEGAVGAVGEAFDLAVLVEERVLREEEELEIELALVALGAVEAAAPLEAAGGRWLEARGGKSAAVALY
jgi:hypothetical protein